MIDLKQAIIGTDTTNGDPRALLLESGVQAFRVAGGYVAPKMTGEGTLPSVILIDYDFCGAPDYGIWERVGTLAYIIVSARFCENCRIGLNRTFDTIFITPCYEGVNCEICGVDIDEDARDLPF